jgi:hypothetical protein
MTGSLRRRIIILLHIENSYTLQAISCKRIQIQPMALA